MGSGGLETTGDSSGLGGGGLGLGGGGRGGGRLGLGGGGLGGGGLGGGGLIGTTKEMHDLPSGLRLNPARQPSQPRHLFAFIVRQLGTSMHVMGTQARLSLRSSYPGVAHPSQVPVHVLPAVGKTQLGMAGQAVQLGGAKLVEHCWHWQVPGAYAMQFGTLHCRGGEVEGGRGSGEHSARSTQHAASSKAHRRARGTFKTWSTGTAGARVLLVSDAAGRLALVACLPIGAAGKAGGAGLAAQAGVWVHGRTVGNDGALQNRADGEGRRWKLCSLSCGCET